MRCRFKNATVAPRETRPSGQCVLRLFSLVFLHCRLSRCTLCLIWVTRFTSLVRPFHPRTSPPATTHSALETSCPLVVAGPHSISGLESIVPLLTGVVWLSSSGSYRIPLRSPRGPEATKHLWLVKWLLCEATSPAQGWLGHLPLRRGNRWALSLCAGGQTMRNFSSPLLEFTVVRPPCRSDHTACQLIRTERTWCCAVLTRFRRPRQQYRWDEDCWPYGWIKFSKGKSTSWAEFRRLKN